MNMSLYARRFAGAVGFSGLIAVAGWWKLSFWVGSHMAFFSAVNCVAPVAGAFVGIFGSGVIFALRTLIRLAVGSVSMPFLFQGIPSLCGALYWASKSLILRTGIPGACMILFWLHPVGYAAGVYALYWIIPIAVCLSATRSRYATALASTFTAHAVGSVIWLYTVPMAPAVWISLVPVVAIERLLFATGMVVVHYVISAVIEKVVGMYSVMRNRLVHFVTMQP